MLCAPLSASLIYDSSLVLSGLGLGAVSTIMTMQGSGQTGTTESGCARWNGTATISGATACVGLTGGFTGSETSTGVGQIGSPQLSERSIVDATQLVIVFYAAEPSGDSINLTQLILTLYRNNSGTPYFTTSIAAPVNFANTTTGIGNAGFSFVLDNASALALNALGVQGTDRVGISAAATDWAGGAETFSLGARPGVAGAVPEPSTYLSLGLGLGCLLLSRRRK